MNVEQSLMDVTWRRRRRKAADKAVRPLFPVVKGALAMAAFQIEVKPKLFPGPGEGAREGGRG